MLVALLGDRAGSTSTGLRALDGDTIVLGDGRRVRLPSIDTPELGRPGAAWATAFSAAWLAACERAPGATLQPVLAPADPTRDRYGRVLADLRRGDESLSAGLIEAGLAWVYDAGASDLGALQADAVDAGRGVHAGLAAGDPPYAVTGSRFHRLGCPWIAGGRSSWDLEADPRTLLKAGRSPCRTCLAWPPG